MGSREQRTQCRRCAFAIDVNINSVCGAADGARVYTRGPFRNSLSVDFLWCAKSVRPIQTIPGTAEQIRREALPVGFGFADGLEQLPPVFVGTFCAVG